MTSLVLSYVFLFAAVTAIGFAAGYRLHAAAARARRVAVESDTAMFRRRLEMIRARGHRD